MSWLRIYSGFVHPMCYLIDTLDNEFYLNVALFGFYDALCFL